MHQHSNSVNEFGYKQSLDRSLGRWATFAAGISFISILTGIFALFGFGLNTAGPAYWWTLPMVAVGQMAVALVFAELAARWPVAGSVYNWGKRVSGPGWSWLAGWVYLVATLTVVASVALAFQTVLPQISPVFQIVGDGTGTYDYSANAVLLGGIGLAFATALNCAKVSLLSRVNQIGVFVELVATVVLIAALFIAATRSPDVVMQTADTGANFDLGFLGAFLVAALAPAYVLFGFDTASSLGEESRDPQKNAPKSVIQAPLASAILGMLLVFAALIAARELASDELAAGGLAYLVKDVLGDTFGSIMLWMVVIAIFVCLLSIQASAVRMTFAMARDNNLPFGSALARVSPRSQTPAVPAVVVGVLAFAILVVNIRQPQIVYIVVSIGVVLIYVAYLMITVPVLRMRLSGGWSQPTGLFNLGGLGLVVNFVAVVWGVFMTVNLAWPRREIYNPTPPFHWYLSYGAVLALILVCGVGGLYFHFVQRHKTGVLADHAVDAADPAGGGRLPGAHPRDADLRRSESHPAQEEL